MRETTERQEAIEAGAAELVGTDPSTITRRVATLLRDATAYSVMATPRDLFGDGHAGEHIVRIIREFLPASDAAAPASVAELLAS